MQDTVNKNCKALPVGQKDLISLPCNSSVAAQRWRPAAYPGEIEAGEVLDDSRLESAANPGVCVMLQQATDGSLQPVVDSCYTTNDVASSKVSRGTQ